jgi:hypothetical protein
MSQHKQVLLRGLAVGTGFVALFGPAIESDKWLVSLVLLAITGALLWIARKAN